VERESVPCQRSAGKVGEILFQLHVPNSVWILILAVEDEGLPCYNMYVGSDATRALLGF
jgi:hypothetical protein